MKKIVLFVIVVVFLAIQSHAEVLRIGLLKIEDVVPVVIAKQKGFFKQAGLNVRIVYFNSALERDAALEAKKIDAEIADPIAAVLLNESGFGVKIVSVALGVKPTEGIFSLLASPSSDIEKLSDLEGKTVAISRNSIIEYVLDRILKPRGIKVKKVEIKKMPLRVEMLLKGRVDAALLPEPLATYALMRGAKLIYSDAYFKKSISHTVWVFSAKYLKKHPDVCVKFKKAYNKAVRLINKDSNRYRKTIEEIARVPKLIKSDYIIPHYTPFERLRCSDFYSYVNWMMEKKLINREPSCRKIEYACGK